VNVVLHALRCMGFTGTNRVATATGLPASAVESELIDLAVAGLVTHTPGTFGGWGLTEAGRAADAEYASSEVDGVRAATAPGAPFGPVLSTVDGTDGWARTLALLGRDAGWSGGPRRNS
jgi:hypothetical protein